MAMEIDVTAQTDAEQQLVVALAWMCEQYLHTGQNRLDHMFMSAGERAIELLAERGLIEQSGSGGVWTDAGLALLGSS